MIKHCLGLAAALALGASLATPAFADPVAAPAAPDTTMAPSSMSGSMMSGHMTMEHGFPVGLAGPDGIAYTGTPDLQAAVSLVVAGGPIGNFSVVKAISAMAGPATANAEVAKLTKQYGKANVASFVVVQNFAVNDAVKRGPRRTSSFRSRC